MITAVKLTIMENLGRVNKDTNYHANVLNKFE